MLGTLMTALGCPRNEDVRVHCARWWVFWERGFLIRRWHTVTVLKLTFA